MCSASLIPYFQAVKNTENFLKTVLELTILIDLILVLVYTLRLVERLEF